MKNTSFRSLAFILMLTPAIDAGGKLVSVPTSKVEAIPVLEKTQDLNKYFIGASFGSSFLDVDSYVENTLLSSAALDDKGTLVDLEVGYKYYPDLLMSLNFQNTSLDQASINNIYAAVTYQHDLGFVKPFFGGVFGYSMLNWDNDPIQNAVIRDPKATNFFFGYQLGMTINIIENINLVTKYQYFNLLHNTQINDESLTHGDQKNILIGLRYEF